MSTISDATADQKISVHLYVVLNYHPNSLAFIEIKINHFADLLVAHLVITYLIVDLVEIGRIKSGRVLMIWSHLKASALLLFILSPAELTGYATVCDRVTASNRLTPETAH